ncbi:MAG TPA: aspartate carbamoyltransferase [Nitrososphaerales archaeon]|nr:aspartate carbamoyltransferase [Nitrososphaerales archaeon]
MAKPDLFERDVVSLRDFDRGVLELIFQKALALEKAPKSLDGALEGKLAVLLFFEPSARTYSSFQVAAETLGLRVSGFSNPKSSSVSKGETLYDTIRMFEGYGADCFVIRHGMMGAARFAAETTEVPVINAGDGRREHPTQAMIDLYTMWKAFGKLDGLKVGIMGDLRYSRTPSSLSYGLSNYRAELCFIAPDALQVRPEVESFLNRQGVTSSKEANLKSVAETLDVLYVTRIQKERIPDPTEYERVKKLYEVDLAVLKDMKPSLKVLHPLPRVGELATEVDSTVLAQYFAEAASGLPLRMALLNMILGGEE